MLSNTLLRITSRRILSTSSSRTLKRTASTSISQFVLKNQDDVRKAVLPLMAAATVGGLGLMTLGLQEEVRGDMACVGLFYFWSQRLSLLGVGAIRWRKNLLVFKDQVNMCQACVFCALIYSLVWGCDRSTILHNSLLYSRCFTEYPFVSNVLPCFLTHIIW